MITFNTTELTVYAQQAVVGVAPALYCVDSNGDVGWRYVPAAQFEPVPPTALPPTIDLDNTTYVFNEVEVEVDIQNLTFVEVVTVQNIEISIYVDAASQGQLRPLLRRHGRRAGHWAYVQPRCFRWFRSQPNNCNHGGGPDARSERACSGGGHRCPDHGLRGQPGSDQMRKACQPTCRIVSRSGGCRMS